MILADTGDAFLTYGPPGGCDAIYRAIEWARFNQAAWGVQIDRFGDKTYPALILSSHRGVKELMAYMNETFKRAA